MNNASVVNSPDLSPIKNIRNGEAEEAEVRKTKVDLLRIGYCYIVSTITLWGTVTKTYYFPIRRDGQPIKLIT